MEMKPAVLLLSIKANFAVWLVVCLGMVFSWTGYWISKDQLFVHNRLDFEWAAHNRYRAIHAEATNSITAISDLRDIMANFDNVRQREFKLLSQFILSHHKGVKALYWVPQSSDKDHFQFKFVELPNSAALPSQHDFNINAQLYEVMNKARDSGKIAISLVDNSGKETKPLSDFLVVVPFYSKSAVIDTTAQRRLNLIGFTLGRLQVDLLVHAAIGHLEPRGIDIRIVDESTPSTIHLLYMYSSRLSVNLDIDQISQTGEQRHMQLKQNFELGDRAWLFTAVATPQFKSAEAFEEGPLVLFIGGLLFAAICAIYLLHLKEVMLRRAIIETQRQHAEEKLRESEEHLRTLFKHSPDVILTLDRNSEILFMNRSLPNLAVAHALGSNFLDWLPDVHRRRHKKAIKKLFKSGNLEHFQYSFPDSTYWTLRLIPIKSNNTVITAMLIATDITETKALENQAMETARLASIGVLAAGVAHEVNNPNNSIYFNANLVADAWHDIYPILVEYKEENGEFSMAGLPFSEMREKVPQSLQWIIDHTQRIKKIVANLKHFAKQDAGDLNSKVNILHTIDNVVSILTNQIQKYTNYFTLDLPGELSPVTGNAQQIEQVFVNIIMNALQSLQDKARKITISAVADDATNNIIVSICDEGVGIAADNLDSIIEPFFTTKSSAGGTGLGLSISHSIIKNHHGSIAFTANHDCGTTVCVSLPMSKTEAA